MPAPQRRTLTRYSGLANRRIIFDAKQEPANERRDRVWRRWSHFCTDAGLQNNRYLRDVPQLERDLLLRAFLALYRTGSWSQSGVFLGERRRPMVANSVREAASLLAAAFRSNFQQSPLHVTNSDKLLPSLRSLLRAFDNLDPAPDRQKALTPSFLRQLIHHAHESTGTDSLTSHTADLLGGGYFFACRSCEFSQARTPGRTKIISLRFVVFRDRKRRIIPHSEAIAEAFFVTIVFADQKNKQKMDSRTQRRTTDRWLCPVRRWASAVNRIRRTVPEYNDDTPICSFRSGRTTVMITNSFTLTLLRSFCSNHGGHHRFGFAAHEIGNKSLRSGAAMALFLANHSTAKIMLLGRWLSDAFLAYIRPQVLEWTNNMSLDMIHLESFLDASSDLAGPTDPRTRTVRNQSFNGHESVVVIPRFYLHN
jgi:hypothetical protein